MSARRSQFFALLALIWILGCIVGFFWLAVIWQPGLAVGVLVTGLIPVILMGDL